jgi:hypothetical protein
MVHDFYLSKSGVVTMSLYEIAFVMLFWFATSVWFYTMGVNTGYTDGRRAVRMQIEEAKKVRV